MMWNKKNHHKKHFVILFIFSLLLVSCSNNAVVDDENVVLNNNDYKLVIDSEPKYYSSIIEITLTKIETKKNKFYSPSDFPEVDFKYIANSVYQNGENSRKTLVAVLNNPSLENASNAVDIIKRRRGVYNANLVVLPPKGQNDNGNWLDNDYITIFLKTEFPPSIDGIWLYTHRLCISDIASYEYTKDDFPEVQISSIESHNVSMDGNIVFIIIIELSDSSVESTLNAFLSLRHNKHLINIHCPPDGSGD